jgi:DNA-binding MarR family transcriptional regulator
MSDIPKARQLLLDLAARLPHVHAAELASIVNHYLFREPKIRRAPTKSADITPSMRRQIFALAKTDMHLSEIGHRLGINQGRVSEVLNGKR